MAFNSAHKARVLIGDFSYSGKITKVAGKTNIDMLPVTTLADTAKRVIAGQGQSDFNLEGYVDELVGPDAVALTTNTPITYGEAGIAVGSSVRMADLIRGGFECSSPVAGVSGFSMNGVSDGLVGFGLSLADLAAVTVDTNGTGVDGTAQTTAGAVAHLHVTAFSGFTNTVFTIGDSSDNVSFATIGTFATVTGATTERLTIAGTVRRYTRVVADVTGTGSVTFAAALQRL